MLSTVITRGQLTLDLEPGLTERYRNLRECIAAGVYRRGLKRVAGDLDIAPGNLSAQLGDESQRNFSVDSLERYIETTGDVTPVHYLVARFLQKDGGDDTETLKALRLMEEAQQLLARTKGRAA